MSPRGRRRRVAAGIFRDDIGLSAVVHVDGRPIERRFPRGTPLRELADWQRATRARAALGLPVDRRADQTLSADIETFLALLPAGPSTADLTMLLAHWARTRHGGAPRSALTAPDVHAQLLAWRRDGAAASTCNHRRRALAALYQTLDGPGTPNPARLAPKLPAPRREPRGLPWPIIRRILVALPDRGRPADGTRAAVSQTKARLWVLATTGWPHAVLARLELRDLRLDAAEPHALIRPRRKGQGARARTVPLTPAAVRALRAWVAAGAQGPFSRSSMHSTFQRAVARARARWEAAEARLAAAQDRPARPWPAPDRIRVYDLRHSFGTRAILASGGNVVGTRELMLHESVTTTMQYLEAATQASARAVIGALAPPRRGTQHGTEAKPRRTRSNSGH